MMSGLVLFAEKAADATSISARQTEIDTAVISFIKPPSCLCRRNKTERTIDVANVGRRFERRTNDPPLLHSLSPSSSNDKNQ
jgi:hypothetical protein